MAALRSVYNEWDKVGECFYIKEAPPLVYDGIKVRQATFQCKCGNFFMANIQHVKRGVTKSCGCLYKLNGGEAIHGGAINDDVRITSGYNSWAKIKSRCRTKTCDSYKHYGAKGITMYDEWYNSFESFIAYMGPRPSVKHTVDRYPNKKGNYEPGNVRWATQKQQMNNKSVNIVIDYNGSTHTLAEWCDIFKIDYHQARYRYRDVKLSIATVISRGIINKVYPKKRWKPRSKLINI